MNRALNAECGPWASQNFGSSVPGTRYDPRLLDGWGVRPSDTQLAVGIQRELLPRLSAEVTYHRRWFGNFTATDNVLVVPSDYSPYSIVAPLDPRLPDGGGYTIDDLWEISAAKFGLSDELVAPASDYGNRISYWHGVDINISGRMRNSLMFQGGTSTGRAVTDTCDLTPKLDTSTTPSSTSASLNGPSRRFCRVVAPFATQFKGLVAYTDPEGGCPGQFHDPEPARGESGREPGRAERNGGANTGAASGRRRQQRDDQPHRTANALRRPHQPGRFPCRESSAIRTDSDTSRRRHLQRDELECPPGIPPDVRVDLAEADLGDGRPLRAHQRADRFLARLRHRPSRDHAVAPPR